VSPIKAPPSQALPRETPPTHAPPTPAPLGKIKGFVFKDRNGNGEQDDNEPGIANVDVVVTDSSSGESPTLTTDADGMDMAEEPPGRNVVDIVESTLLPGDEQRAVVWSRHGLVRDLPKSCRNE
jgi:hypothetical protein